MRITFDITATENGRITISNKSKDNLALGNRLEQLIGQILLRSLDSITRILFEGSSEEQDALFKLLDLDMENSPDQSLKEEA